MTKMPYRARTETGDTFDIEFPLHEDTVNAVRVAQLVTALLEAVDRDIGIAGETSNGDVLQAAAMTMAIRARMIHAPHETIARLSTDLLETALDAIAAATHRSPQVGHA